MCMLQASQWAEGMQAAMGYSVPSALGWDAGNVLAYQQMYQQYMAAQAQQGIVGYQVGN